MEELNNKIDYDNLKYVIEKSGVKKIVLNTILIK